jgi:hypothetical protein
VQTRAGEIPGPRTREGTGASRHWKPMPSGKGRRRRIVLMNLVQPSGNEAAPSGTAERTDNPRRERPDPSGTGRKHRTLRLETPVFGLERKTAPPERRSSYVDRIFGFPLPSPWKRRAFGPGTEAASDPRKRPRAPKGAGSAGALGSSRRFSDGSPERLAALVRRGIMCR